MISILRKIVMEMQHADVLDIKKKVVKEKSFLSKMAYYEYFTFNISSWIASNHLQKCPAVTVHFAIRRETFDSVGGFERLSLKTSTLQRELSWWTAASRTQRKLRLKTLFTPNGEHGLDSGNDGQ